MKCINASHALLCLMVLLSTSVFATERMAPMLADQKKVSSPSTGANTLYSVHRHTLDEQGYWTRASYFSIQINDIDAARDYGRISISYNDYYALATLEFANVLSKDGQLKSVSKDAIQLRSVGGSQDFYEDRSEIVFSLPQVEPGSLLEFQITYKTQKRAIDTVSSTSASPYWFQQLVAQDGWRADPVTYFSYQKIIPAKVNMHTKVYAYQAGKPDVKLTDKQRISTWTWTDIPELTIEHAMPPSSELIASIHSSTDTQWQKIDAWTWGKVAPKLVQTDRIDEIINSLDIADNATDHEKIMAVYAYLQKNIRYVFAHLGRGGYEPHFPNEILDSKYGDCKDQTVLALVLLNALGIEAYPALVETINAGKSDTSLVKLIFDHMLVWIPASATHDDIWMDTSGDSGLFPGASAYLHGQPALIVNGQGGKLVEVDMTKNDNLAHLNMLFTLNDKRQVVVDVDMNFQGSFEQNMRHWWQHDNNRETQLKQIFSAIFDDASQYQLTSDVLNSENFNLPLRIVGQFTFTPLEESESSINLGVSVKQLQAVFGSLSGLQIPSTRKNRYVTTLPMTTKLTATFMTPENFSPTLIQSAENFTRPYINLQQTANGDDDSYVVDIDLYQPPLNLSVNEYATFYQELHSLGDTGAWVIHFALNAEKVANANLSKLKRTAGENTVAYQISLAQKYIDSGEFEQALPAAKKAVELDNGNSEAWYMLGVARGLTGLIDESQMAFEKAKQLGYVP